ncbi:hypothetical protein SAMN06296273_0743 [Nitrosomonas ureae]|uniref:Uncharacterized protein n=1 Tax=Nitrosomonas ureae TaxID=44577 RepID=A0A285BVI7_9PROT|nr:hypothetical protein SAMN06296273_0743 [Nitrosomonas ureae]
MTEDIAENLRGNFIYVKTLDSTLCLRALLNAKREKHKCVNAKNINSILNSIIINYTMLSPV